MAMLFLALSLIGLENLILMISLNDNVIPIRVHEL